MEDFAVAGASAKLTTEIGLTSVRNLKHVHHLVVRG